VLSIEPASTKPYEEVADQLKREVAVERAKNDLINVQEKIEDERLGGATLADAARKFKLKPLEIEVDRGGKTPDGKPISDLPQGADVLSAAFSAEVHGENEPLRLSGNGYVWYDVAEIKPSRERPLDEVKEEVLARWRDDQVAARLKTKTTEMLDKIKAGTPFNEVVGADNLKVEWRPGIKRSVPPPGLPGTALAEIFRTPKDSAATVESGPAERVLFRVTEIKVPPLDPGSADTKRIDDALRARTADDLVEQYIARLQSNMGVTINQAAVNQAVGGGGGDLN
jgi:peptidyl-prolyl cis-trans isomerase D